MGPPTSLRPRPHRHNISNSPGSATLVSAATSLVTLEPVNPGGTSTGILRFVCPFPNLGELSVARHSESSARSAPHYETSRNFCGVLTHEYTDFSRDGRFVQGLLKVPGGLRSQKLVLKFGDRAEPLIPACSQTLRTLFYQPRRSGAQWWRVRDIDLR